MSLTEKAVQNQMKAIKKLDDELSNFLKEPKDRLENLDRLQSWIPRINALYIQVQNGHTDLLTQQGHESVKKYFTDNEFNKICATRDAVMSKLNSHIAKLTAKANAVANNAKNNAVDVEKELAQPPTGNSTMNDGSTGENNLITLNNTAYDENMNTSLLNNSDKDFIDRFIIKMKCFEQRLDRLENIIDQGNLQDVAKYGDFLTEKWGDITDELESVCAMVVTHEVYMDQYAKMEPRYLRILGKIIPERSNNHGIEPVALKLKPIQIQPFAGDIKQWTTFSELFKTLILDNRALNDVQKMQYLKTSLTGNASKVINQMEVASNDINVAWKLLQSRYSDKRAIMNMCLDNFIEQPKVTIERAEDLQQLLDTSREYIALIKNIPTEQIMLRILSKKLPTKSLEQYESTIKNPKELQNLEDLLAFLEQRTRVLSSVKNEDIERAKAKNFKANCLCCNDRHAVFMCEKFKKMDVTNRIKFVKDKDLCNLCLKPHHTAANCRVDLKCKECQKRHNTLLHIKYQLSTNESKPNTQNGNMKYKTSQGGQQQQRKAFVSMVEDSTVSCVAAGEGKNTKVLMATAQIRVKTKTGWSEELCALIDQGSMSTFISDSAVRKLNLKRQKNDISVSGIGGVKTERSLGSVNLEFTARYPTTFTCLTNAIILPKLATLSPITFARERIIDCNEFSELVFADPYLNRAFKLDMILGLDVFATILMNGVLRTNDLEIIAQETQLGWIVSGVLERKPNTSYEPVSLVATINELSDAMQIFWRMEEMPEEELLTAEEEHCLKHYNENTTKNNEGRYVVAMPFTEDIEQLGNSRRNALAQQFHLERKFNRYPELRQQYSEFMNEYINMGHMVECSNSDIENGYYLPHHAVFKESTTTKLRVVFDGSRKTSSGLSLNDCMMVGPKVQDDLFNIMMRFRLNEIAFTADIAKMYRQIMIQENQQDFQRILWREHTGQNMKEYRLTTVTYGTSAAPFLAVQTLMDIAKNAEENFPEASQIIRRDFYMDDLMGSAANLEQATKLQTDISNILAKAGLQLRKWSSNNREFLETIPIEQREGAQTDGEASISTLGLRWFNFSDQFGFKMNNFKDEKVLTKRTILSEITKMYDPLGLLAPFNILCKILMQKLWIADLSWDDAVPIEIVREWESYKTEIPLLLKHRINRWMGYAPGVRVELHGFSDASEKAYGAVIYAKITNKNKICCNIITSKTRVAPISKQSLPRLELAAALLLAKLMKSVETALQIPIAEKRYYSDSKITLAWIHGPPRKWETFVGNRVAKIQQLSKYENWRYVNTKENPADIASRGMIPQLLITSDLWWHGPQWLIDSNSQEFKEIDNEPDFETTMGARKTFVAMNLVHDEEIIKRFSSLNRAVRTIAYCKRFGKKEATDDNLKTVLTVEELDNARLSLIKLCQKVHFEGEMDQIKKNGQVNKNSKLKTLFPFMDGNEILRVGGRLNNSEFSEDLKHPVILPYKSHFTKLVIDAAHKRTLHGGNQLTTMQIRHNYWIIGCKRAVKHHINQCVKCHRFRATSATQLMGSLPADRTKAMVKPFTHTGTDFCGPFYMRMTSNRRQKTIKGYVAIFICFSTRAVHLEAVSDLTAEAFLAAFKRFISRRGNVAKLYSDNGGNFVKARKILELETSEAILKFNEKIKSELANLSTRFYFNPPAAPWFGGLWERNIGSVKHHFKRTIGDRTLSYEEMTTVLSQIEACLNSRPLCPINENSDDINPLTPGHFLIGSAITAPITPALVEIKENRLSRWQLCERLKQDFWRNWSNEYIANLQRRTKWQDIENNLKIGDLVLMKDEINPPLRWPLARITNVFNGKDGLTRVVEVTTGTKKYKRAIGKLSKLPIESNEENNRVEKSTENVKSNAQPMKKSDGKSPKCSVTKNIQLFSHVTLLLTMGLIAAAVGNDVKIEKLENNLGIYFENLGQIEIKRGQWRILSMIDLQPYYTNYETLNEGIFDLEHVCKIKQTRMASDACEKILIEVENRMQKIKEYDALISFENRRKREPISIGFGVGAGIALGWVSSKLSDFFRDSDQEEKIQNLEALLKEQTSVLSVTEQVIRKNQNSLHDGFKLLVNQTVELFEQVDALTRKAEMAERSQWISTHLLLMLIDFQEMQKHIIEVLTTQENKVNSFWVKPEGLKQQINLIENNIGDRLRLVGHTMNEKLFGIYQLANTEINLDKNKLILVINIPLFDVEPHFQYHMSKIPIYRNNEYLWHELKNVRLIVNQAMSTYVLLTEDEVNNSIKGKVYNGKFPTLKFNSTNINCEAAIFSRNTMTNCNLKINTAIEHWVTTRENNKWIATLPRNTTVNIQCANISKTVELSETNVISSNDSCLISTKMIEIMTNRNELNKQTIELSQLSKMEHKTTVKNMSKETLQKLINQQTEPDVNELATAIKKLQEQQFPTKVGHWQWSYHNIIAYGLIACICLALILRR